MTLGKDIKSNYARRAVIAVLFALLLGVSGGRAQQPSETPPPPSNPRPVTIPNVTETVLPNGLKVVVVSRRGIPLVTASLLVKSGANLENEKEAGLADITASLLIKGTTSMTATEIAEQIEFLGGDIGSGAGWTSSSVNIGSMSSGLGKALSIMSDTVIRPSFPEKEIALLKKQTIDDINVSLKQPGAVMNYVSNRYSFGEHLAGGTRQSIGNINRNAIVRFHRQNYRPENSVLIFTGDISEKTAFGFAKLFFGGWQGRSDSIRKTNEVAAVEPSKSGNLPERLVSRLLVIDLPDAGQAAVGYMKRLKTGRSECDSGAGGAHNCRSSKVYFPAGVLNSVLGGGYSARLNQEIRLKRGLSYGARSGFDWRSSAANFGASTQTKNESAAHVAELIQTEIEKLIREPVSPDELVPRKAVVTGGFGLGLQTNRGVAGMVRDLYLYGINPDELNEYMNKVEGVSGDQIMEFASKNLKGGDIIVVGDSKMFIEDLQKRFPNQTIEVIKAEDLNLDSRTLRKAKR